MTTSDIAKVAKPAETATTDAVRPGARTTSAPGRPSLSGKAGAPVLVKLPPPFAVRLSQIAWVLSLVAGAVVVVYMFVIRQAQLPAIIELVRAVDATRAEATYTTAADIIFWAVFTPAVAIVLVQIALQVSFANRRPNVRWWLFGTVLFQAGVLLIAREFVAFGERGAPLDRIMLIQLGLAALGLLISLLPPALRWTARRHDVRSGAVAPASDGQL
ncbi:hypothetical protein QL996_15870 [Planococcus sp. APC 4015]|nr:hypothetical protein [Planococcus sp. APC 4015]